MNIAVYQYAERTIGQVNSPGKLVEWIEALPVPQSEILDAAPDLEVFNTGVSFRERDKDQAWEQLIRFIAQAIYVRSMEDGTEIVWRIKPEFTVRTRKEIFAEPSSQPDWLMALRKEMEARPSHEAAIVAYFRCAFRKGEPT